MHHWDFRPSSTMSISPSVLPHQCPMNTSNLETFLKWLCHARHHTRLQIPRSEYNTQGFYTQSSQEKRTELNR